MLLFASDHLDKKTATVCAPLAGVACALTPGEGPSTNPKHQANEDSLGVLAIPGGVAAFVADSHWGARIGELLVREAVDAFARALPESVDALARAMRELASRARAARAVEDRSETTFLAAIVRGSRVLWASVADSHLYELTPEVARRLNADLPLFAGADLELAASRGIRVVEAGERFVDRRSLVLLASDGIAPEMSGVAPDDLARELASGSSPLEARLERLVDRARRAPRGGRDNLALVAIDPDRLARGLAAR